MKINHSGFRELQDKLKKLPARNAKNVMRKSLRAGGREIVKEAKQNANLFLEMPKHGGQVGCHLYGKHYYNEKRALKFVLENR